MLLDNKKRTVTTARSVRVVVMSLSILAMMSACEYNGAGANTSSVILSVPTIVSTPTGVGTTPAFALSPKGDRAIAWVSAPGGGTDGRLYVSVNGGLPATIVDPLGSVQVHSEAPPRLSFAGPHELAALYVVAKDVGRRFPVSALRFVRSTDGGATWSTPVTITDDATELGSHNFHSLSAGRDGVLYASWLDGREGKSATYFTHSSDGGRTWVPNQRISLNETCPCCRTTIAADGHGLVYAAWRAVFPGNVRDIVVARSADHGVTWSDPVRVHADDWVYPGCPHAGPSLQLDAVGNVDILWWTGKPKHGGVFYATSADSGKTFSAPTVIAAQETPAPTHVQLAVNASGTIVAAWDAFTEKTSVVNIRVSRDHGKHFGEPVTVSDAAQVSQYPVIGADSGAAYVAWSQMQQGNGSIESAEHHDEHGSAHMPLHRVGETQVVMRKVEW